MFKENKYTTIENARSKDYTGYTEKHHKAKQ